MMSTLTTDHEFDLMVNYQINIESQSTIVRNAPEDEFQYSLYEINKPYPTYAQYLNGNDFDESLLIMNSFSLEMVTDVQELRRKDFKSSLVMA